ncbi:MAG: hypothetical protein D6682_03990 [Zetaproteobacteria bacterium]|nr:MAG: hypothetical protein D6682_03990 [Zetaproteobacteria bacterium]
MTVAVHASCAFTPGADPPAPDRWRSCPLPDVWDRTHPDFQGYGWYRILLPPQTAPDTPTALLLTGVNMNAELRVGGRVIGRGGRMEEPVARHWNRPLYFDLPTPTPAALTILVFGYANNNSGLGPVWIGPARILQPIYHRAAQSADWVSGSAAAVVLALGLLFLIFWLGIGDRAYLFFALGSIIGALYIFDAYLIYPPLGRNLWERLVQLSIGWSQLFYLLFVLESTSIRARWLRRFAWLVMVTTTFLVAIAANRDILPVAAWSEGTTLLWDIAALALLTRRWLLLGDREALIIVLCLIFVMAAFIHDWLPWITASGITPPYLFFLGPTGFALAVTVLLIVRFISAHRREHAFRTELQRSLAEQERELADRHARILELERQQAVRAEQDRVVRELHDGVGGHLASAMTLAQAADAPLRERLREALDELRLLMDSSDGEQDFHALLAMQRWRLGQRLADHAIELHWESSVKPTPLAEDSSSLMHLQRIIQEAVTNSVKYAGCRTIRVTTGARFVEIRDDGCGLPSTVREGRGLKNMRWRAEQLGARCTITGSRGGTTVRVSWPESGMDFTSGEAQPSGS